ncbi:hypothetical protein HNQ36_005094 [Afipia massiliensis]|uniref:Uncharacterized protein n=1 Tax=Afipia massiliensis TaxID=211460 RepID=A0A840N4W2_9BRAD|nr:hypothetical protein [Afipia massiliensis]
MSTTQLRGVCNGFISASYFGIALLAGTFLFIALR